MVSQTFGDTLVCATSDTLEDFPSPESLKKRVIISTKHPKEYLESKSSKVEDDGSVKESTEEMEMSELDNGCGEDEDMDAKQQNAATEYKHMIAIRAEKMKSGIKPWLRENSKKAHRVSLNEEKLENAVLTHGTEIVR